MKNIFIIAEAGVNHNGDYKLAFELVDKAVEAGADAIKFQTFKADKMVTKDAPKAEYQQQNMTIDESQHDMLRKLELSHEVHHELFAYCKEKGIEFLSTAFDSDSLSFLVEELDLKTLKIPSGEITNAPFLLAHAQTGNNLIVSTGMSLLSEVEQALGVIAFGLLNGKDLAVKPSRMAFQEAYCSTNGQKILKEKVTILHCTSDYPALPEDINLNAMATMRNVFGLRTGYSDHSKGISIPIAAATIGASIIEKHFTLDNTLPGPDHKASLEPDELKTMVSAIREIEQAMGKGEKIPKKSEIKNRLVARKSLVAATKIKRGEVFSEQNIVVKRPGTGNNPMNYWDILGKKSQKDYCPDELINE